MNNYLVTIVDVDGDYDFFTIVATDMDHAWNIVNDLFTRLNKITSGDYGYVYNVELI